MTTKENDWKSRKLMAIGLLLIGITLAILGLWWYAARKRPRCSAAPWWPKAALGKKAIKAGKAVVAAYAADPGNVDEGFGLPDFADWQATTRGTYYEWLYTQVVIDYLVEGDVAVPEAFPPCVMAPDEDCAVCKELRSLKEHLDEAIAKNPAMGAPKS